MTLPPEPLRIYVHLELLGMLVLVVGFFLPPNSEDGGMALLAMLLGGIGAAILVMGCNDPESLHRSTHVAAQTLVGTDGVGVWGALP